MQVQKAMALCSSTLAQKTPWTEEPGRLQSMGSLRVGHNFPTHFERLHFHFSLSCFGEGKGNPFQCSCLENPSDRGAWWASIYGVAQSWTRLKRLSSSSMYYTYNYIPPYLSASSVAQSLFCPTKLLFAVSQLLIP